MWAGQGMRQRAVSGNSAREISTPSGSYPPNPAAYPRCPPAAPSRCTLPLRGSLSLPLAGRAGGKADRGEARRPMADDVHRMLNGTKPADVPIYQTTKFEFVINVKAAKRLGLIRPRSARLPDELIE